MQAAKIVKFKAEKVIPPPLSQKDCLALWHKLQGSRVNTPDEIELYRMLCRRLQLEASIGCITIQEESAK